MSSLELSSDHRVDKNQEVHHDRGSVRPVRSFQVYMFRSRTPIRVDAFFVLKKPAVF